MINLLARGASRTFPTSALLLKFFTLRVIDAVCMLLNVLALCTVVRIPAICYAVGRKLLNQDTRGPASLSDLWYFLGIFQLAVFIIDIPFMLMSLPLMIFFWIMMMTKTW